MTDTGTHNCWLESLERSWLKLPCDAIKDVGPAAQTLGGVLAITNKDTFVTVQTIAENAWLPKPTVKKHLLELFQRGWLINHGRGRTRAGRPRRTNTVAVTRQTTDAAITYLPMPRWATRRYRNAKRLSWSERVIVSLIFRELMTIASVAKEQSSEESFEWDEYDELGGDDRFRWSLSRIECETGLSRPTIVAAKKGLWQRKIIAWAGSSDGTTRDRIAPNQDFKVAKTPASPGYVYYDMTG